MRAKPSLHMKIRPIEASDIRAVADCHLRAWQAAFRGILSDDVLDALAASDIEESWHNHASNPGRLNLVAESQHGIVGFVAVEAAPRGSGTAGEVIGIYVHPEHWRAGAGKQLLAAALGHLSTVGFSGAFLWTMKANQRSRAFYENCGLRPCGKTRESERFGEKFHEVQYCCQLPFEA